MVQFCGICGKQSTSFLRTALKVFNVTEKRQFSIVSSTLYNANKIDDQTNHSPTASFDKDKFDNLVQRCYVYDASYGIYGGSSGFVDLGPIGSGLKTNILQIWRQQFVLKERMFEIDCPSIAIPSVFKASGHLQRFNDYIVKDVETSEGFRLDHLIKEHLETLITTDTANATEYEEMLGKVSNIKLFALYIEKMNFSIFSLFQLDGLSMDEMSELLTKFNIKSPKTGNDLSQPEPYNLMFGTGIGQSTTTNGLVE